MFTIIALKKRGLSFDLQAALSFSTGVQLDEIDPDNRVVVEVYTRVGAVKGAQLQKSNATF
ncbi:MULTISPECIES: hypothetical protein [unclassified Neptuniibacter]|uniref:hypothetical protein n=1 Tax=unclassified Neptuniibacter TaxID=2630693 RepID=UPI000C45F360|nr:MULTISPECIES: hypothetical protein [unclassified Neptuniibacter]MAY43495.1 hypothetical protein [Oceanospirillaceae bacterium]